MKIQVIKENGDYAALIAPTSLTATGYNTDFWQLRDNYVVRVHRRKRRAKFTQESANCPVPITELESWRQTTVRRPGQAEQHYTDEYPNVEARRFREVLPGEHWTGETTFKIKESYLNKGKTTLTVAPPPDTTSNAACTETSSLQEREREREGGERERESARERETEGGREGGTEGWRMEGRRDGGTEGRRERASGVKAGESQTSKNNREYIVFGGWSGVSQPRVRFQAHCHKSEGARLWPDWQDLLHAERLISLEARFRKIWQFKCFELCLGQSNFA